MLNIVLSVSFYKKHFRIYDSFILEYIWIDGRGNLRSKYRTACPIFHSSVDAYIVVKNWNYDGSSTHQASTCDYSEISLIPVAHYANPFFEPGRAFLILCDTYYDDGTPTHTNFRSNAVKVFEKCDIKIDPWFKIEQEYFIMQTSGTQVSDKSLLFLQDTEALTSTSNSSSPPLIPEPQGDYYCGVGSGTIILRKMVEKHYEHCLNAGLKISGINAEDAPSQWRFQIGPCSGIDAADELWVARYILHKLSEEFGVCVSFKPKPLPNSWNDSHLHITFSTQESRDGVYQNGLKCIYKYINRISKTHAQRIRIPKSVLKAGCGYLEDGHSASDADPYYVTSAIFTAACFD